MGKGVSLFAGEKLTFLTITKQKYENIDSNEIG